MSDFYFESMFSGPSMSILSQFFSIERAQVTNVASPNWILEDFAQSCEVRLARRFAEMGIDIYIPPLPELNHYPRRPRSVFW